MEETTEGKLKTESSITQLKSEYKRALVTLEAVKNETTELLSLKDSTKKILEDAKAELNTVIDNISNSRLQWVIDRNDELDKLEKRKTELETALAAERSEIEKKHEEVTTLVEKNTEVLNENRRMELKLLTQEKNLEFKQKAIDENEKSFDDKIKSFQDQKESIKKEVTKLLTKLIEL